MDMDTPSQSDSEQNTQNPSTATTSSWPIFSGGENRHEARLLPGMGGTHPGFMGKHRMTAAIGYLDQQIKIIQEEIDQLETFGECSIVCNELVTSIESIPDALLPVTKAPVEIGWDRWFQGGHGSKNRKRWI